jgi:hypothetical protein
MKQKLRLKKRRNFLPTLLLAFLFWMLWGGLIYYLAPVNYLNLIVFFFLLFMASFFTLALLLANSRQGLIVAIGITGFFLLRYHQLGNPLNLILLGGILISLNLYLAKR